MLLRIALQAQFVLKAVGPRTLSSEHRGQLEEARLFDKIFQVGFLVCRKDCRVDIMGQAQTGKAAASFEMDLMASTPPREAQRIFYAASGTLRG